LYVVWEAVTSTRSARSRPLQHRYGHAATASWWTERNLIVPHVEAADTLRNRRGKKVEESAHDCNWKGVLVQPHCPRAILRGGVTQQHTATAVASAAVSCTGRPPSLEAQPASTKAVSSSLSDMSTVVSTIFQQIITELSAAESEEDRIMAITKTVLKLVKQNGC
jgi:hypothetical protein